MNHDTCPDLLDAGDCIEQTVRMRRSELPDAMPDNDDDPDCSRLSSEPERMGPHVM
jgi:hypothetical protein